MAQNQKLLPCYFCGNSTLMNLVGEHISNWDDGEGYYGYSKYHMYECPVCRKVSLMELYWDMTQTEYHDGEIEEYTVDEILYPINTYQEKNLPKQVKEAFEAALKTKNIDNAVCLIALRRTLEIILKEKGAEGSNLWNKIEDLSKKGILPQELKHASTITKTYGNMGAHDSQITIQKFELEQIVDFVKYVMEYLYILPGKLKSIQILLEKRESKSEKNKS